MIISVLILYKKKLDREEKIFNEMSKMWKREVNVRFYCRFT